MTERLRFHWHRLLQWAHQHIALFAKGRFDFHWDCSEHHGWHADLLAPPCAEQPPPEWKPRFWDCDDHRDPADRLN
ncbi:hypothetical protein [Methylobacterium nigriterrae]|uniref:hypothetical protein n=1 Tax=Methylobacterium nigriterrae TaxID=3127512 RepID=UPI003013A110